MFGGGAGNELVVAVDFGTTRTAYATTRRGTDKNDIEVSIPSGASRVSIFHDSKTPSSILLNETGTKVVAYGYAAEEKYANKKYESCLFFRHFKLGLANAAVPDPSVKALNGRSLRLSVVISKALEYVKDDAVKNLNAKGFATRATSIIWVITVPTMWNDWAKEMMRNAAYNAGMICELHSPNLKIALEPECACISLQMEKVQGVPCGVGDKLMIVDCGGGTVDITAHQVEQTDPLSLKELMAPDGGPYGAMCVDAKFYEFLEAFIGGSNYDSLCKRREFLAVAWNWEDKKVSFTGSENDDDKWLAALNFGDILIALNMNGQMGTLISEWNKKNHHRRVEELDSGTVGISFNLMMSFFEGPIQNIVDKINSIVISPHNRPSLTGLGWVVIAGGFGRSAMLQKKIRENLQDRDFKVVICPHPDLAIVKGATAFGTRPEDYATTFARERSILEQQIQRFSLAVNWGDAKIKELERLVHAERHESQCKIENLTAQLQSMEEEKLEMARNLTFLLRSQSFSGPCDFPLETETTLYLKKATNTFETLYYRNFNKAVKGFSTLSCHCELSLEMAAMLQLIWARVRRRYEHILKKMLDGLEGLESVENASNATKSFCELYCRNYWKELFLGKDIVKQDGMSFEHNFWAAKAFEAYCESDKGLSNSLMLDIAWRSLKNPQPEDGKFVNFQDSGLWKVFKRLWDAIVVMYLQRPRFEFEFTPHAGWMEKTTYNSRHHQLLDGACKEGDTVIVIIPAVYQDRTGSGRKMRKLAHVVPKERGKAGKDWPGTPCYIRSAGGPDG